MERLKSLIPINLKHRIFESTLEDLPSTSSSLLQFFLTLSEFQQVTAELTDPEMALCRKNVASALDLKQKGNECFLKGDFAEALSFYTQALRFAPMNADDMDKNLVVTIYVNRATSMHKMGLLEECIRDCNRAVVLFPLYAKAWYRRGKANVSLEKYEDAIHNLNVALGMEHSLSGKSRIKDELETMLNYCKRESGTSNSCNKANKKDSGFHLEQRQPKLQCVSTSTKGRGMASLNNVEPGSLVHTEEPYAAIILKHCRETHCHFCFNELPVDTVPCSSCTISVYCSDNCQEQAGGKQVDTNQRSYATCENISVDLERYIMNLEVATNTKHAVADANLEQILEHQHECGGAHWAAVLPPECVLAGRVLVKHLKKGKCFKETVKPMKDLDLCHNYIQMPGESKLRLHIYSIVLACCLQQSYGSEFPFTGASVSQLVILISQIRVNSMAIVHIKSSNAHGAVRTSVKHPATVDSLKINIEQVRVGQAIYPMGSLFNHSCQPNIHAYFLSRTLFLCSTEFVPAGFPLEISYGPQVGQWDLKERQQLLEEQYSFKCQCSGCSQLNLSDLVIHAFQCVRPDCYGAVLNSCLVNHKELEANCSQDCAAIYGLNRALPDVEHDKDAIDRVAHLLLERTDDIFQVCPGCCLSCGSYLDLESSCAAAEKAWMNIKRLRHTTIVKVPAMLCNALKSYDILRSIMHAYSKDVAEANDILAEAFCLTTEFQPAMQHCKASIEILARLYHTNHIVIGNELLKLASIQLSIRDYTAAVKSINRLDEIFSLYYGSQVARLFPYLENLRREAEEVAK